MENCLAPSYQIKHASTLCTITDIPLLGIYQGEIKNACTHTTHFVEALFILGRLETTSFLSRMDKQIAEYYAVDTTEPETKHTTDIYTKMDES